MFQDLQDFGFRLGAPTNATTAAVKSCTFAAVAPGAAVVATGGAAVALEDTFLADAQTVLAADEASQVLFVGGPAVPAATTDGTGLGMVTGVLDRGPQFLAPSDPRFVNLLQVRACQRALCCAAAGAAL